MQIRSDILRIYQKLHLWTGICSGILLFICFFAGALTMFKTEIAAWASPPSHVLPQVPVERLDELLAKAQAKHPEISQGFTVHPDDPRSAPLTWSSAGRSRGVQLQTTEWQATLDGSGKLISQQITPNKLAELIDQLHRTAGIPGVIGHDQLGVLVMGVVSVLYFLALVSGVIFLLPTLVKTLFALRRNKGANRFWLDTHNLLGITALPFHIVIALTVVVFAFHDQFYDALNQAVYKTPPSFMPAQSHTAPAPQGLPNIATVLQHANDYQAGYQARSLTFAGLDSPRPMVRIEMYSDSAMMRGPLADFLALNPYNQNVMFSTMTQGSDGVYGRIVAVFFGLHFGSYAGMPGRWLYFILGLSGAMLFYSGNLLWLEKRRKLHKNRKEPLPQQPKRVRVMAALTVGCCLGSVVAIAASMLLGKWLYLWLTNVNYAYLWSYYGCFAAALAYCFYVGAARGAILLLRLASLLCIAMPLSSMIASVLPNLGLWAPQTGATWLVDMLAAISAWLLFVLARKTAARAQFGQPDSIWALPASQIANATEIAATPAKQPS